ncbi:MAG: flavodoxin FldA [Synechococcales cyanobacterium RU_4_20]|nr:flavodoxin FldA [Synechococcales cyanobacterium RU_4_20]NJR67663.1 flavodoxin FldA [Synechococcales cyanobacterium CRU_2_2]
MMMIGLFYGTQTGNTETIAEQIQVAFGGDGIVTLHEISDSDASTFGQYQQIIIGCPTWNIGELQSDWDDFYEGDLNQIDFSGKQVAYFGPGDQVGYSDNFQDAMGLLEEKISGLGGETVGHWPTDGYEHDASKAVKNGKFVGLALDEDNQPELTDSRIQAWVGELKLIFGV